jgi:putative adenylate-forming enzyme
MRAPVVFDKFRLIAQVLALRARDRWNAERLERHRARAFERLRRFAQARSPFYGRFHKGLETAPLERLPSLTKGELMATFDEAVTDRNVRLADVSAFAARMTATDRFRDRYHIVATSGTTGERGYFLFDPAEWRTMMASGARVASWATDGRRPKGERGAMMTTAVPWHLSARMSADLRRLGIMKDYATFDSGASIEDVVAQLNAYLPEHITVYPSMLQVLAGEQMSGRLHIKPKRIQCSAEVMTAEAREAAVRAFRIEPSNTYAASEFGALAGTCGEAKAMHLADDMCIVENVDDRGRPVPPGEAGAKVLLSVLFGRTLPLIRYELNDRLTMAAGQCTCGRPFTCLSNIEGRSGDILEFAARDGGSVSVSPMQLGAALRGLAISGWQFATGPNELNVACVATTADFSEQEIVARIGAYLDSRGAVRPTIRARRIDKLARGASGKTVTLAKASPSAA